MDVRPVDGLAETFALFDRLPDVARDRLAEEVEEIAGEVLAAQRRDVAKRSGALAAALSLEVMIEGLRARVGLLSVVGKRSRLFYGRIIEAGRRAQTVMVKRRPRGSGASSGRRRRRRADAVASVYSMKVRPMAPRPFVRVDRPEIHAEQRLANFWSKVASEAGASE